LAFGLTSQVTNDRTVVKDEVLLASTPEYMYSGIL